uniref:Uncharacterized protein n=1 Tax=Cyprinus carpio TaxID=7962 RepID=A0A8C2IUN7_CYPCA
RELYRTEVKLFCLKLHETNETLSSAWRRRSLNTGPHNKVMFTFILKFLWKGFPSPFMVNFPVHRNSFVLLQAPVYGKREWEISSSVQKRFIPVHSTADVVKGILVIAKATSKPNVVNLSDQMSLACTHIIDHSPVWKMLQEMEF